MTALLVTLGAAFGYWLMARRIAAEDAEREADKEFDCD